MSPADAQAASAAIGAFAGGFGVASLIWAGVLRRELPRLVRQQLAGLKVTDLNLYKAAVAASDRRATQLARHRNPGFGP